jgi:putative transposase
MQISFFKRTLAKKNSISFIASMSTKYKFKNESKLYFVTLTIVHWIDLFIRNEYKNELIKSWEYCKVNKGLEVYGFCIMTSHVHMIIGSHQEKLQDIMRDMKSFTSSRLRKTIQEHPEESRREWLIQMMESAGLSNNNNRDWQLWQQNNHPIELYNRKIASQKLNYIHYNPIAAGFVDKEEEWLYSSARNYIGLKGIMEVDFIE